MLRAANQQADASVAEPLSVDGNAVELELGHATADDTGTSEGDVRVLD